MIRCKPERNPRQAVLIVCIFVVLAILCAVLTVATDSYKWISQIAFLMTVALGMQFIYRYTMSEMVYCVGEGVFSVVRIVGKKEKIECSLNLQTAVELVPKSEFKRKIQDGTYKNVTKRYNFNQNIKCKITYVYVAEFNGEIISVEFEPNDLFLRAMYDEIDRNKMDY